MTQTEIAIVGAGPAGLSAALAAAEAGAQVTVIDACRQPGGQYFRQPNAGIRAEAPEPHQREGRILWQKAAAAGVKFLAQTTVWGAFEGNRLTFYDDISLRTGEIQAKAIILAPGTYERVAAFPGWTLPGVMTTGAAQTLLKEQRILPGQQIVLAGTGPLQLIVAAALVEAGANVVAVLEGASLAGKTMRRPLQSLSALRGQRNRLGEGWQSWRALRKAGVPYLSGWGVIAADGESNVEGARIAKLDENWRPIPGTERRLSCDTLCLNYGFTPATELSHLLGLRREWRPEQGGFVPLRDAQMQSSVPGIFVVGDGAGVGGAGLAMLEGEIAGLTAAMQVRGKTALAVSQRIEALDPALHRERRFQKLYGQLFTPAPGLGELAAPDTLICRCESVSKGDISQAIQDGADTLYIVKGLTRCGMGNCQGRVCGPLAAAIVAKEMGQSPEEVGQFRPRVPLFPLPLSALADEQGSR